jgi:hypothetical protein
MSKGSKGPGCYPSSEGNRGIPGGSKPKSAEKKAGPIVWTGAGGNKGIPPKSPGKGMSSKWAATHD